MNRLNNNLISIIIPIFNASAVLEETLASVCNQSYKNIEILLIDDGSTDGSLEIAKRYNDNRIRVFKNKRKGACAARNYGLEEAQGDYIQFLDADDLLSASKIEDQLLLAQKYGDHCLYSCGYKRFKTNLNEQEWQRQKIDRNYKRAYLWLNESWLGGGIGAIHNWLIPKALCEKAGDWDETLVLNQDGEYMARVIINAKSIIFCDTAMVYYRSGNAASISQNNAYSKVKASSLLKSYKSYRHIANEKGLIDELRYGLGHNFLNFIYQYYGIFPELILEAKQNFYDLGLKKMYPVGGSKFKILASLIGLENALKLKKNLKL